MPDRDFYSQRMNKKPWLRDALPLNRYLWSLQPMAAPKITAYLRVWFEFRYLNSTRPLPIFILCGPPSTGKTEVARAMVRYFMVNMDTSTAEFVFWPDFVADQMNGQKLVFDRTAKILILDDFDSRQPVNKSLSPWIMEKASAWIKPRAEIARLPTVITMNRHPASADLLHYLSTSPEGRASDLTKAEAKKFVSALQRHCFEVAQFKPVIIPAEAKLSNYYNELRQRAETENDMAALGFDFVAQYRQQTLY